MTLLCQTAPFDITRPSHCGRRFRPRTTGASSFGTGFDVEHLSQRISVLSAQEENRKKTTMSSTPLDLNGAPMSPESSGLYWQPGGEMPHQDELPFVVELTTYLNKKLGKNIQGYWELHNFSVTEQNAFWEQTWAYLNIIGERGSGVRGFRLRGSRRNLTNVRADFDLLFM